MQKVGGVRGRRASRDHHRKEEKIERVDGTEDDALPKRRRDLWASRSGLAFGRVGAVNVSG
jgi:hypothetical protein